ncbi:hypothetical protein A4X13_0g3783 [Tilletia indica]|uniref:NADAR domain-containing protein n=1 Tax=Tilletia indica TaxID=43049 RepID=A0A177T932_9BASI|nr:hypothetical protein A4X13_0g3783 [Tilletia indica]
MADIEVISTSELSSERSVTPTIDTDPLTPQIFFGIETEPFFFLSPLFPSRISTSHFEFPNAEAAFQASKFAHNPELQSDITKTVCAKDAIEKANRWTNHISVDWEEHRIPVMKSVQMLKYAQNIQLQARLLQTGDAHLIYKSETDSFFGSGNDGQGLNHLGRILMEIRSFFKAYLGTGSLCLPRCIDLVTPPTRSVIWGPNIASEAWYPRESNALKEIAIEPAIADAPAGASAFLHSIVHGDKPWTLEVLVQLREEVKEGAEGPWVRICQDHGYGYHHSNQVVEIRLSSEHLKSSLMIDGGIYIYGFPLELRRCYVETYKHAALITLLPSGGGAHSGPEYKLIFTLWKE